MPSFDYSGEIEFEVFCNTCGDGLCNQSTTGRTRNRGELMVRVEACTNCTSKAEEKGYQAGYAEAQKAFEQ